MKPAWDQLGTVFKESDTVLIGDVDCTTSINKELCSTHGVKGCEPTKLLPEARPFCASVSQTVAGQQAWLCSSPALSLLFCRPSTACSPDHQVLHR